MFSRRAWVVRGSLMMGSPMGGPSIRCNGTWVVHGPPMDHPWVADRKPIGSPWAVPEILVVAHESPTGCA